MFMTLNYVFRAKRYLSAILNIVSWMLGQQVIRDNESMAKVFIQPVRILIRNEIIELLSDFRFKRVLDVGGGVGRHQDLFKNSVEYLILDNDPKVKPHILADAEELPFEGGSFDCVLCSEVLEHVKNPLRVIQEIERVLAPDGILILTVPLINELHAEPFDFQRFTIFGLENMLSSCPNLQIDRLLVRGNWLVTMWQLTTRLLIDYAANKPFFAGLISQLCRVGTALILRSYHRLSENRNTRFPLGYSLRIRKIQPGTAV